MTILVLCTVTHFYTVAHLTALTALKQLDPEFEAVAGSLKIPFYKLFFRVTLPVCLPAVLEIAIYLFVNAMTTVSAVVFLYATDTKLASVAILNMDDAGDIAPAAAMGMMIFSPMSRQNFFTRLYRGFFLPAHRAGGVYRRVQRLPFRTDRQPANVTSPPPLWG